MPLTFIFYSLSKYANNKYTRKPDQNVLLFMWFRKYLIVPFLVDDFKEINECPRIHEIIERFSKTTCTRTCNCRNEIMCITSSVCAMTNFYT